MSMFSRTVVLATALPLAACVPSASSGWLVGAADPRANVRPARYATVTTGVQRFDVVDPKNWIEQNRRVTPKGGSGGMEDMDHSKMPGMGGKSGPSGMEDMDHSKMPGMGGKRDTGGR